MTLRVYVLRGGLYGWDGPWTSSGMDSLVKEIGAIANVTVSIHNWSDYYQVAANIFTSLGPEIRVAIVGYSGGGLYAAVVANMVQGRTIDLIVALDPSPPGPVAHQPLRDNVLKAICYRNLHPWMLGLGGGLLVGKQVIERRVSEQHLAVQFDATVRAGTLAAIAETAKHTEGLA